MPDQWARCRPLAAASGVDNGGGISRTGRQHLAHGAAASRARRSISGSISRTAQHLGQHLAHSHERAQRGGVFREL
jgi:hypothetical protein